MNMEIKKHLSDTVIINKVNITEEAVFDYEYCIGYRVSLCRKIELDNGEDKPIRKLNKRRLKIEIEEYIELQTRNGRLLHEKYFRCKYYDREMKQTLMLFFYKADKLSIMQYWNLVGICFERDWSEEAEEFGVIRSWLKSRVECLVKKEDGAVKIRVNEILEYTEKIQYEEILEEIQDEFEHERDKVYAEKLLLHHSYHFKRKRERGNKRENDDIKKRAR